MLRPVDVRDTLEEIVASSVLPIARRYHYASQSLEDRSRWRPIVLLIGNYSSGKSTFINEFLGGSIQRTGQAPTDDCFTILAGPEDDAAYERPLVVLDEVPGSTIVNDASMPFGSFKEFGSRFMAHFTLKRVNSPKLRQLAIIDSPGMLDSVTELDRGYDYQKVVGRFAELADLVVLVFDPFRAGTIKETYDSIRSTLPEATSEDRVVFVLNRVDECGSVHDLVRCYGVLCWNLSQMTGRKDIPRIFLTHSPTLGKSSDGLAELAGERSELVAKIEQAPRLQVSHQLGIVDHHLHKLELISRTLARACSRYRSELAGYVRTAVFSCVLGGLLLDQGAAILFGVAKNSLLGQLFTGQFSMLAALRPLVFAGLIAAGFYYYFRQRWFPAFHQRLVADAEQHAELNSRYARDLWQAVGPQVRSLISDPKNLGLLAPHRSHAARLRKLIALDIKQLYERHLQHGDQATP